MNQDQLRAYVGAQMSVKRFTHTLGVEAQASQLAKIYGLSDTDRTRLEIAALLHDLTKEKKLPEQIELCERFGIPYTDIDCLAPKVFHAKTAARLAKELFPALADDGICRAIEVHTVGAPDMSLFDALLYLADYIEAGRTFPDCVRLRKFFYDGIQAGNDPKVHLLDTLLLALDMTILDLLNEGAVVASETVATRNALLLQKHG